MALTLILLCSSSTTTTLDKAALERVLPLLAPDTLLPEALLLRLVLADVDCSTSSPASLALADMLA